MPVLGAGEFGFLIRVADKCCLDQYTGNVWRFQYGKGGLFDFGLMQLAYPANFSQHGTPQLEAVVDLCGGAHIQQGALHLNIPGFHVQAANTVSLVFLVRHPACRAAGSATLAECEDAGPLRTWREKGIGVNADKQVRLHTLGHVHAREVLNERPRIVFCGNLQGRHAKETGAKGCELVTVEAGRVEAEFIALDVVRWSQLSVPLDGVDRLESLNEAFARALEPVLAGTTDRLHAVRVTLTGSTELHRLEAAQPGTLAAAMHAAAQDIGTAEIWIEQVRLDLSTPLDRARAAQRQDAVGELVRLVDTIAGDDTELMRRAQVELGDLLGAMPAEVTAGDVPRLDDPAELRSLLMDAEATVLARLSASGEEA